jgi:RimJ/RimL family protein N-acetyltransferase
MIARDFKLETQRLVLRLPEPGDFEGYVELMGDPQAAQHIGGVLSRTAAWRKFLQMPGAWWMQGYAMFSVVEKSSSRWLGQCGPWQPEGWPGTEVGWALKRDAWGKGYAREAAIASIDWAFENLGWTEVIHSINPDNGPSQALAQRLGSRILRQANLPPPYETVVVDVWGQSREEWFARRKELAA